MKIGSQVYASNSIEAVKMYCKAFGVEISFEIKNEAGTAYEHCELSVDGQLFLAVSKTSDHYNLDARQTMTFNVYQMDSETTVQNAFDVLSKGGTIIHPIQEVP